MVKKGGYVDTDDLETIDYNNNDLKDTNTNNIDHINLKKTSPPKKLLKKYRNIARKKPYRRPLAAIKYNFADLEIVDYNIDTNVNDLNDVVNNPKK